MSVGSPDDPFVEDGDADSVGSGGPYVYESPWDPAAIDPGDTSLYTNQEGTVRVLERDVADLPVLSSSDSIDTSGRNFKTYGLRMVIPTRVGKVWNTWEAKQKLFTQSMHFRVVFPLRPLIDSGEECEILENDGWSMDLDVIAPAYAPDASDESTRPFTWNIEGCFHPNWVAWRRQVDDPSVRVRAGQKIWSTAIAHFFFPVDGGIQKAGYTFGKNIEFPEYPTTAHGYGVCEPKKYKWKDSSALPSWLDVTERSNTMGFVRMSTRFNMAKRQPGQETSDKLPESGDYPFHVLLYWPRKARYLRETKWAKVIERGGFFQVEGRAIHFVGKMIGMLNRAFLSDVPLGVFIPVIVPEQVYNVGDGGAGSGAGGSSQFGGVKMKTTPKKVANNTNVGSFRSPLNGGLNAGLSPSAGRSRPGQKRGLDAPNSREARSNGPFGFDVGTPSATPVRMAGALDTSATDVVDVDSASQASITDDGSGREGSPDRPFDAPPSSQTVEAMEVDPVASGGFDGTGNADEAEHSGDEPQGRGTKRNRAGKAGLSEKAAGKRRSWRRR